jgi:HTH-type transcriptional repressor of NAD biosynthesis genes
VPWLVCDTDAQATTLWHERYVGHLSPEVAEAARAQVTPYARILTGDEIPWVQDGMRDGEDVRHAMQDRFRETLTADDTVPWVEVTGSVDERVEQATAFLRDLRVARPPSGPTRAS